MTADRIVVSAPGKVLLAGGYLVLDQQYAGLVVATSARFFSSVKDSRVSEASIRVRSPQFLDAEWVYQVQINSRPSLVQLAGLSSR
jgi:phosphomevalonate kinase